MREILFRAFVKDKEKIFDVITIDFFYKFITFEEENKPTDTMRMLDQIELMQYTGLKDKNGTKIFEGDIIKTYHGNGKVVYSQQYALFGYIMLEKDNTEKEYDYRFTDVVIEDGIEVIGNIHDNPELLGGDYVKN